MAAAPAAANNNCAEEGGENIEFETANPHDVLEPVRKLGAGAYGTVWLFRHRVTKELLAVKEIILGLDNEIELFKREIAILRDCSHPNVVSYRGTYRNQMNTLWITMEFCTGGSVENVFKTLDRPLSERQIAFVCREMLKGLIYLHSRHIIHRDIKAGNVLVSDDGSVKLADFGVAAKLMNSMSRRNTFIGTMLWMAPEAIQEKSYDERADIWSLGITAIEMAEMAAPRADHNPARALFSIPKDPPPMLQSRQNWSEGFHRFLARCLVKDPMQRPTAEQLIHDPFVNQFASPVSEQAIVAEVAELAKAALRKKQKEHQGTPPPKQRVSSIDDVDDNDAVHSLDPDGTFLERSSNESSTTDGLTSDQTMLQGTPVPEDEDDDDDGSLIIRGGRGESIGSVLAAARRTSSIENDAHDDGGSLRPGASSLHSLHQQQSHSHHQQQQHAPAPIPECVANGTVVALPMISLDEISFEELSYYVERAAAAATDRTAAPAATQQEESACNDDNDSKENSAEAPLPPKAAPQQRAVGCGNCSEAVPRHFGETLFAPSVDEVERLLNDNLATHASMSLDPSTSGAVTNMMPVSVALLHSFEYHRDVRYRDTALTKAQAETSQQLVPKYGSVLKTILRM